MFFEKQFHLETLLIWQSSASYESFIFGVVIMKSFILGLLELIYSQ
jgi:hypothetical protein